MRLSEMSNSVCQISRLCAVVFFVVLAKNVESIAGCPPEEDVFPCRCYNSPMTILHCTSIHDSDELKRVFSKSEGYRYREVTLEQSALQYLPYDTFRKVHVVQLNLKNVTLVQLFDEVPENLDFLDTLHIENTDVFNGMTWDLLKPLVFLRILNVYFNSIPMVDEDFKQHVTYNLEQLSFYATGTSDIEPGVFDKFKKLNKLAIDSSELTKLSRNMFPVPFNVRFLYFNGNKLRVLSKNLFSDMPRLHTLGLKNNHISAFQAEDFRGTSQRLVYVFLEGNPLICDCRLRWLVVNRPEVTSGMCDEPDELRRRPLSELTLPDLKCLDDRSSINKNLYR